MTDLVDRLRQSSIAVGSAAEWVASQPQIEEGKDNYLFEFLCYVRLLLAAQRRFSLEFVKIGKVCRWPKAPALKSNYSYVKLLAKNDNTCVWHACTGTKIDDIHQKPRAPDISIQRPESGDNPTFKYVQAIWDAKFHKSEQDRISDADFAKFRHFMLQLDVPKPAPKDGLVDLGSDIFSVSALLTNGDYSTENDKTLINCGFSEVRYVLFTPEQRPSRQAHLSPSRDP